MNILLQLTIRGAVTFAAVAFFDWLFAARISARVRRAWWLLVPLAFFLTVPLAVLPEPPPGVAINPPPNHILTTLPLPVMSHVANSLAVAASSPSTGTLFHLSYVVAVGAVMYLAVVLVRTRLALRCWRHERLCTDAALLGVLEDCKATANITAPIGLVVSEAVSAPVIMGWLRPRILLPSVLVTSMSCEQLRAVLFHELAHFRSLDIPCGWLFTLTCALHWFNPAAHLALRAWARFREEAADETAITWLGQSSAVPYGETLLHVLRTTHGQPVAPFTALGIVESLRPLRRRITMIKQYEHKSPCYLLAGTVLLATACILLHPVHAAQVAADPPTPESEPRANAEPIASPAITKESIKAMLKNPTAQKAMRTAQNVLIRQVYADLVKQWSLPSDQADTFYGLLLDKQMASFGQVGVLVGQGSALPASTNEADGAIKIFLGDGRFQQYTDYAKTAPDRLRLNLYKQQLATRDVLPLTPNQADALLGAMIEEGQHLNAHNPTHAQSVAAVNTTADPAAMDEVVKYQDELNGRIALRAAELLNPEQLAAFNQFQKQMLDTWTESARTAKRIFAQAENPAVKPVSSPVKAHATPWASTTLSPSEEEQYTQWCALGGAAKASLNKGDDQAAKASAEELARLAPKYPKDWNYGNAVQDANVVLGRLALKAGDVETAKRDLLAAGHSPGSPQMDSFGPNMSLANNLLAKGEKAVVLDYFDSCKKFWKMDNGRLDQWKADVQADRVPDFGANLDY